jgi:hypothetical protein
MNDENYPYDLLKMDESNYPYDLLKMKIIEDE